MAAGFCTPHLATIRRGDDDLLRCGWLGRIKLIIARAVRHLAIAAFQNGRWRLAAG